MSETMRGSHVPHGADKELEPEDPLEGKGQVVPGDPIAMLDGLVEEFARMGMPRDRIVNLFENPGFVATYGLTAVLGAEFVHDRIDEVLARCGIWSITVHEVGAAQPCGATGVHGHVDDNDAKARPRDA